jgi:inner membrane protein
MPTVFTHAFAGLALGKVYTVEPMPALCPVVPDLDIIGFAFGVRYGDALGHRGFTHSLLFALLLGCLVAWRYFREVPPLTRRWWSLALYFAAVIATHGLTDALTTGGLGIAFFSPFDNTRYFLPWPVIEVSPIGLGFFSRYGLVILWSEFVWVWIPSIALAALAFGLRRAGRLF